MAEETKIEWTNHTWNPWQGCRKVSPGCKNCYMYRDKKRYGQEANKVIRSSDRTFKFPTRLDSGLVFVCSWSDFFIEDADPWRDEAWEIIRSRPDLQFQLLTKRPHNIMDRLPPDWPLDNVWLGITAENQQMFDERIAYLALIDAPVKFVSMEPLLSPIAIHYHSVIDWVIVGGETGGKVARPMGEWWATDIMAQCKAVGIKFFMKQMTNKGAIPDHLNIKQMP